MALNLFYGEPDPDRWLPFDRYPRRLVRRIVRGPRVIGGMERVFLNFVAGLREIGAAYRLNDYRYIREHPDALACIFGKPFVLDLIDWQNPIVFGAAAYSHPVQDPNLLDRRDIRKVIVLGEWQRDMYAQYWGGMVVDWATGIDSETWAPAPDDEKDTDVLLYDKVRWRHDEYDVSLIQPVRKHLESRGRTVREIRYGYYREADFHRLLRRCRTMVFLCEHETQGIAYQQALSCNVPIFAWDRGGPWQDPAFYPHLVQYGPVTSVPYWDEKCGARFRGASEFISGWDAFWSGASARLFAPREFVVSNLSLEKGARDFLAIVDDAFPGAGNCVVGRQEGPR
jgi:glycosyltransferase involved in cell wall biosynthesis